MTKSVSLPFLDYDGSITAAIHDLHDRELSFVSARTANDPDTITLTFANDDDAAAFLSVCDQAKAVDNPVVAAPERHDAAEDEQP